MYFFFAKINCFRDMANLVEMGCQFFIQQFLVLISIVTKNILRVHLPSYIYFLSFPDRWARCNWAKYTWAHLFDLKTGFAGQVGSLR